MRLPSSRRSAALLICALLLVSTGSSAQAEGDTPPTISTPSLNELISEEQSRNDELEENLKLGQQEAQQQLRDATKLDDKNLAKHRFELEETKAQFLEIRKKILLQLEERLSLYESLKSQTLVWQNALRVENIRHEDLKGIYSESVEKWRDLVDDTFEIYSVDQSSYFQSLTLPEIPIIEDELFSKAADEKIKTEFSKVFQETQELQVQLQDVQKKFQEISQRQHYNVLRGVGTVRSQALMRMVSMGDKSALEFSSSYFKDLLREAHLVPYRVLALLSAKTLEVRQRATQGFGGIFDLVVQGFTLLLILLVPLAFWWAMKRSIRGVDQLRSSLLRDRHRSSWRSFFLVWIPRVAPFVPWIILLIFVQILKTLLLSTVLLELVSLLPYISYYALYRIFRVFVSNVLVNLSFRADALRDLNTRHKIDVSARSLGIFLFWTMTLLHAVESVVNRALVYRIVLHLVWVISVAFGLWILRRWKDEIVQALKASGPQTISDRIAQFSLERFGLFWRFVGLVWLLASYLASTLQEWFSEFDFMKRISARWFRRRLESNQRDGAGASKQSLPEAYTNWFGFSVPEDERMLVQPETGVFQILLTKIEAWIKESYPDTLVAITGPKGSGKSSLLSFLKIQYGGRVDVKSFDVPPKITTRDEALAFVAKVLGLSAPISSADDLFNATRDFPPTLILLDECQNLYLSRLGGFDGYNTFTDLINSCSSNLFWVCVFNQQAWNYLDSAFGRNAYFRSVYKIWGWSEDDIKKLILARHRLSGFKLSFDQIISAASHQSGEVDYTEIETKFFRLLWEQANGNPRAALYYWLSSLSPQSESCLKVGIPAEGKFMVDHLSDEQLFVLACLVKHENLSTDETMHTTHLSEPVVRHAFKLCSDSSLVEKDKNGRYRVTPEAQGSILRYLRTKNFIYE